MALSHQRLRCNVGHVSPATSLRARFCPLWESASFAAVVQEMRPMPTLVLIRHGQSAWNLENRFTGWWDVDVTEKGVEEARAAGRLMAEKGLDFDQCYTSLQTRAIKTLNLALEEMGRLWLPVEKDWRLNERHYGGLTGLNKAETAEKHGEEQVKIWRRSFDIPPPVMEAGSAFDLSGDRRYAGIAIPSTESLKDTIARVLPYLESVIAPDLKAGKRVLISAHGNSLRALVKHLSGISDDEITGLEIPTGQPIVYELADDLTATDRYYLSER
jgi:2,3-bisphosphoglycerate-dependent phosphoglycerate mutase